MTAIAEQSRFIVVPEQNAVRPPTETAAMQNARELEGVLNGLFPRPCEYKPLQPGDVSGTAVLDRIIDKESIIGSPPEGSAREALAREAQKAVDSGRPLVLVGIYGTPRSIDNEWLNKANLSDLSTLMMVQAAMDRAHTALPQGVRFRAVDEDLTALWLDTNQQVEGAQKTGFFKEVYRRYFDDRKRLIEVLVTHGLLNTGNTSLDLFKESAFFESIWGDKNLGGESPEDYFMRECERVRPVFAAYIAATNEIIARFSGADDGQWHTMEPSVLEACEKMMMETPEFAALKQIGWSGSLPPIMRQFYLRKFRQVIGDETLPASSPELISHVATYLSSTLTKSRMGTLTYGIAAGDPVIKMPLVKPVDGRPSTHQALLAQRTIPYINSGPLKKRVSNTNASAWSCVMGYRDGKVRLLRPEELKDIASEKIVPAEVYIRTPDNGAGPYLAKTVIVLE